MSASIRSPGVPGRGHLARWSTLIVIVGTAACGGGGGSKPAGPGPGPDTTVSPSITGWSPEKPMLGETVVLTGTGFSPTASENVVTLTGCRGGCLAQDFVMPVVSATTTSIRAELPWEGPGGYPGAGTFKVEVKGKSGVAPRETLFRWPLTARSTTNLDYGHAGWIRPGDRMTMRMFGLGSPAERPVMTINGKRVDTLDITNSGLPGLEWNAQVSFVAPVDVYPGFHPSTRLDDTTSVIVTVSAQGQTVSQRYPALRFPRGSVDRIDFGSKSLTHIMDPSTPTSAKEITITGHNMVGPISLVYALPTNPVTYLTTATSCGDRICDTATGGVPSVTGSLVVYVHYTRFDPVLSFEVGILRIVP